jgi:hypothetical protein
MDELLSVSDHIGVCNFCQRLVERSLDADEKMHALKSEVLQKAAKTQNSTIGEEHLTLEQMASYVDGNLKSKELRALQDHLIGCAECELIVDDLFSFRAQVVSELGHEYQPLSPASERRVTGGDRWRRFFTGPSSFPTGLPALISGSVLSTLLLLSASWVIWRSFKPKDVSPDSAQATPSQTTPMLDPRSSPTPPSPGINTIQPAQLVENGRRIGLNENGELSGIDNLSPEYRRMIERTLKERALDKPSLLAGLTQSDGGGIRSGSDLGDVFRVTEPAGKVILSDRPTFRWTPLPGATSYTVEIYNGAFNLLFSSPPLTGNSWTASQPLRRGETLSWQVKAIKDVREVISPRPPQRVVKFRILDPAKAEKVIRAKQNYSTSHLTLGLIYAQYGLLDDAERELRSLQKENPDSDTLRRLLNNISKMRR